MLSFTLSGKHIHGRPITLIVASLIVYLIYFILFLVSCSLQISYTLMFISFHVRILCMYHILSYLVSFHITYFILSCTFIYILILLLYGTFVCFNLVLFMYCTFICLLPVLVFFIFQFYDLLHSMQGTKFPIFRPKYRRNIGNRWRSKRYLHRNFLCPIFPYFFR